MGYYEKERVKFKVKSIAEVGEYECRDAVGRLLIVPKYEILSEDGFCYLWSTKVRFEVGDTIKATLKWKNGPVRGITRGTVIG